MRRFVRQECSSISSIIWRPRTVRVKVLAVQFTCLTMAALYGKPVYPVYCTHPLSTNCTVCVFRGQNCTIAARIVLRAVLRTSDCVPGTYAYCVRIVQIAQNRMVRPFVRVLQEHLQQLPLLTIVRGCGCRYLQLFVDKYSQLQINVASSNYLINN